VAARTSRGHGTPIRLYGWTVTVFRGRKAVAALSAAIAVLAIATLAAADALRDTTAPSRPGAAAALQPCGWQAAAPARYDHVVWIFMENKTYSSVIGSVDAPFENELADRCGLATNFHNVTHHSLANYIAATSGLDLAQLQPFRSDCGPGPGCQTAAPSLFSVVGGSRSYLESMPGRCVTSNQGTYGTRHNPALYYTSVADCKAQNWWLGQFDLDLAANRLPAFSFVAPNLCHDTHDCSVRTGDDWLRAFLTKLFESDAYRDGSTAVFLSWDEGEPESSPDCLATPTEDGCHIPLLVMSPSTPAGTRAATSASLYSLLRTTQEVLGSAPLLGEAQSAPSLRAAFGL
jgi:hypothetical protein